MTLLLVVSEAVFAAEATKDQAITKAETFFNWLEANQAEFIQCKIKKDAEIYKLCDGTEVKQKDLTELFKMEPNALVKELESRGIHIEILCDTDLKARKTFATACLLSSKRAMFKEMNSLHGQYLPEERTILLRSSALKGSLIHEYIHYLQSENRNLVFGKVYKKSKNQVKKDLTAAMDKLILNVQELEKAGKKSELAIQLDAFMKVSNLMQKFAPWQDLIDEREIFLLYLGYGNEFGADAEDKALAQKNMGFICRSKMWMGSLPALQCALK